MRRRTNAAPCWSPFWPVRAATPSAARPKPCETVSTSTNLDRYQPYGSEEGIVGDLREDRTGVLTGAGGDVLRQLLTGRCVAVHKACRQGRAFPWQVRERYGRNAKPRGHLLHAVCIAARSTNLGSVTWASMHADREVSKQKEALRTLWEDWVDGPYRQPHDGSRRAMIWGSAFPAARSANAELRPLQR
jgi:hypothetical protein